MASVSDCLSESCGFKSRQYCKTGKITIGCLPALDAGGCRFEIQSIHELNLENKISELILLLRQN